MAPDQETAIGAIRLPIRRIHVELTNCCNFSCEFCPDGKSVRPRGEMEFSALEQILSDARGICEQVHFHVMGEPTLYPRLIEAVRLARRLGFAPFLTTNGSLLSPKAVELLAESGLEHLTISLQTPDEDSFGMRGAQRLSFLEYKTRIVDTVRAVLSNPTTMRLTLVFLANPLLRFFAPDPPRGSVPTCGKALRARMSEWAKEVVRRTPCENDLPLILRRIRNAGILKESLIPLSNGVSFRVRILGNWAGHFELPVLRAKFGYCPGVVENFGILWNGDYVVCCTDFDGKTVMANHQNTSIREYLSLPGVQGIVQGFQRYRVFHPHCGICLGERTPFYSAFRQFGSIFYFKYYRRWFGHRDEHGVVV